MYIDKNRYTTRPTDDRIPQEFAIYDRLEELSIPFVRVDHDHADTIEFCQEVEAVLGSKICKNLFLCNRQQTEFYLLMMPATSPLKPNSCPPNWGAPGCPSPMTAICETSFRPFPAPYPLLELLFDAQHQVQLVIDRDLLADEFISGHPGRSTSTLQLKREDLLRFVESTGHSPIYVDLPDPRMEDQA